MSMLGLAVGIAALLASVGAARADDLEDAYRKGYDNGYQEGLRARLPGTGSFEPGSVAIQPGTIMFPGSQFETSILPRMSASKEFQFSPDSSIAIIPNDALPSITQKLGVDFLRDNNIILNNETRMAPLGQ